MSQRLEHGVHRLLRREPSGGVAHAVHGDEPGRAVRRVIDDRALAQQLHVRSVSGQHRQQAAVHEPHIRARQGRPGKCGAALLQKTIEIRA